MTSHNRVSEKRVQNYKRKTRKRLLGRPKRRKDENIWRNIKEIAREDVDETESTPDRFQWRALVSTAISQSLTGLHEKRAISGLPTRLPASEGL
jgi:hypothetical protein